MNTITINQERLARVTHLLSGGHGENNDAAWCAMEAVAYVAGEPWSDHPQCACPVISTFMRNWNDNLPDNERDMLLPLVPKLVGTRATKAVEMKRAVMCADWLIRIHTPAWLRLAKLEKQAALLEALPEITDFAQCPSLMPTLEAVKTDANAAWDAARAAAGAAAWDAARDAARAAAWAAAWDAAGAAARAAARAAAWDAARAAAWAAAWDAARDAARAAAWAAAWDAAGAAARAAARAAAWDALADTKRTLQQSAFALVERMIECRE